VTPAAVEAQIAWCIGSVVLEHGSTGSPTPPRLTLATAMLLPGSVSVRVAVTQSMPQMIWE
jgi:hypothetical protein